MTQIQELVINFHMTEACNYRCGYCYATWENNCLSTELHHSEVKTKQLLKDLASYFLFDNPLRQQLNYRSVRINFAGGEPLMLGHRFVNALLYAKQLGFNTSVITNGHLLNASLMLKIAPHLNMLGLSFDTADSLLASNIGRTDRKGDWLSPENLLEIALAYRTLNPHGRFKINTVVNAYNWREDLVEIMQQLEPDKWKLLRVLPVHEHNLTITSEQYRSYVERHSILSHFVVEEDNDAMWQSYLMINPKGCFYQNSSEGKGHSYSKPILDVGVGHAFTEIDFNLNAFVGRYPLATNVA